MIDVALKLADLTKEYSDLLGRNRVVAVSHVDLEIRQGEVLGLLGPNGAGKTSIVKMISGLVLPDSGAISINGRDVVKERSRAIANLGVLLEGNRNVYWRLTPRENLRYFLHIRGYSARAMSRRIEELLQFFDLTEKGDAQVNNLSRGMQQKLALAVSLVHDPAVLILDEPTLGLDVETTRNMKSLITRLAKEEQKTILLTTHQMNVAQDVCDRIAIISGGKILVCADLDQLLAFFKGNPNLEDIFMAILAKKREEGYA